jgi:hypothetical protein
MSNELSIPSSSPGELLATVDALRRRTRAARRAYWFPLLLFGLLSVIAAPLYVDSAGQSVRAAMTNPALTGLGGDFLEHSATLGWYWLVALIGGYLLSLGWYRWHAWRVGVQTPTRPYVVAGVVGILLGLALPIVIRFLLLNAAAPVSNATRWATIPLSGVCNRGMVPHLVIAAGLVVLARLERSRGLAAVAATYAAVTILVNVYFQTASFQPGDLNRFSLALAAQLPTPVLLIGGVAALVRARRKAA